MHHEIGALAICARPLGMTIAANPTLAMKSCQGQAAICANVDPPFEAASEDDPPDDKNSHPQGAH